MFSQREMIVREAKIADIATVFSWFNDAEAVRIWGGPALSFPFELNRSKVEIEWNLAKAYVLSENDAILGFVQVFNRFGFNHIARLAIEPRHQGKGLGRKFIEQLLAKPPNSELGFSLFVYVENLKAKSLYEGLGFVEQPYPLEQVPIEGCVFMVRKYKKPI